VGLILSAASLFLIAAGLSIIFGVTRIVNFAHGSFYMLGAYIAYSLIDRAGGGAIGFWGSVLLAAIAVGVIGAAVEMLLLRRIYRAPELFQLLATFGVVLVVQDAALWIWGPEDLLGPRAPGLDGGIDILGQRHPEYYFALIAIAPAVLGGLWLLFHWTRWGVLVRAATQDREMVGALGVNQAWLFTSVFFLGALLAGLGGALQLPKDGATLLIDLNVIAAAFVVVVVGGMGSITGAFLAAILIGQLQAFAPMFWPEGTEVIMFLAMAVVLIVRPWGLMGKPVTDQGGAQGAEPLLRPTPPKLRLVWGTLIALLLVLPLTLPLIVGDIVLMDEFTLVLAVEMIIAALFAASLHFIMGPGGMVSFGHGAGRIRGGDAGETCRGADGDGAARRPRGRRRRRAGFRLVLRAVVGGIPGHADPGLRADRLVGRLSVARGHGRRRRAVGRLAVGLGQRQDRVLLSGANRQLHRDLRHAAGHLRALRLRHAGGARFLLARRGHRYRRQTLRMDGLRGRRRDGRRGRRAVRVFQGQRVSRRNVDPAFGGRAGDGAAGGRADPVGPDLRRRSLHLAAR
jgi:branched-subunit amino acid ABC-type transport system permease component